MSFIVGMSEMAFFYLLISVINIFAFCQGSPLMSSGSLTAAGDHCRGSVCLIVGCFLCCWKEFFVIKVTDAGKMICIECMYNKEGA